MLRAESKKPVPVNTTAIVLSGEEGPAAFSTEAYAERIVRAVNSHEALVKFAELAIKIMHFEKQMDEKGGRSGDAWDEPIELGRAALALAEGR